MTSFLKIANIETLYFDRMYALHSLPLEIKEGEIFAIPGPNGAGKTTLLKTISGLLKDQPKKGIIEFCGRRIQRLAPERVSSLGIVYVPEDRGLFRELTVKENLELGCWGRSNKGIETDMIYLFLTHTGHSHIVRPSSKQFAIKSRNQKPAIGGLLPICKPYFLARRES